MNLYEFTSLEEAQAHTVSNTKMISSDQMRIFILQTGLYGYFKEHAQDLQTAAYDNMSSGGEFNFIEGHPSSVSSLFDGMIAGDTDNAAALQSLADACYDYANTLSLPYLDATQEEYEAAVADQALKTPIDAHSYTLQGFETNAVNAAIVKTGRDLIVDVIFDAPVTKDCVVSVTALLFDKETSTYVPETVSDSVRVSTGSTAKNYRIKRNFSARKMKFTATCNYGFEFQVKVAEA